jgi:hypothetical protein
VSHLDSNLCETPETLVGANIASLYFLQPDGYIGFRSQYGKSRLTLAISELTSFNAPFQQFLQQPLAGMSADLIVLLITIVPLLILLRKAIP